MRSTVLDQASLAVSQGRDAVQGLRSSTVATNDLAQAIRSSERNLLQIKATRGLQTFGCWWRAQRETSIRLLGTKFTASRARRCATPFSIARASRIEVGIQYDQRQLRLRIRDNGNGIDPKVLEAGSRAGHYGLPGLHERAKLVGGKLTVASQPGSGTEIELTIPASTVYASTSARRSIFSSKSAS